MRIVRTDHIAVNVVDMEESVRFYGDLLGLEKGERVDMGDHMLQYFEIGGGSRLELIQYYYETEQADKKVDCRGKYRHIAYLVKDLDALWERLKAAGALLLTEPSLCEKLQFRNILLEDPNGVEIELVERLERKE